MGQKTWELRSDKFWPWLEMKHQQKGGCFYLAVPIPLPPMQRQSKDLCLEKSCWNICCPTFLDVLNSFQGFPLLWFWYNYNDQLKGFEQDGGNAHICIQSPLWGFRCWVIRSSLSNDLTALSSPVTSNSCYALNLAQVWAQTQQLADGISSWDQSRTSPNWRCQVRAVSTSVDVGIWVTLCLGHSNELH